MSNKKVSISSNDFMAIHLTELVKKVKGLRIGYRHDDFSNTHIVFVRPLKTFKDDKFYDALESAIIDDFVSKYPDESVLFHSEGSIVDEGANEYNLFSGEAQQSILPEKWGIEKTSENAEKINEWLIGFAGIKTDSIDGYVYCETGKAGGVVQFSERFYSYEEITYDDFIRLVYNPWKQKIERKSEVKSDGWISCSEKMPERGDRVLCFDEITGVQIGWLNGGNHWVLSTGRHCLRHEVTHWQELPNHPK